MDNFRACGNLKDTPPASPTNSRFPPQASNLAAFGWRSPSDFAFDSIQSRDAFHRIDGARRFVRGLRIAKLPSYPPTGFRLA
jgi:hypothetical protein